MRTSGQLTQKRPAFSFFYRTIDMITAASMENIAIRAAQKIFLISRKDFSSASNFMPVYIRNSPSLSDFSSEGLRLIR